MFISKEKFEALEENRDYLNRMVNKISEENSNLRKIIANNFKDYKVGDIVRHRLSKQEYLVEDIYMTEKDGLFASVESFCAENGNVIYRHFPLPAASLELVKKNKK